jgi:phosphoribosyl 1,2-cyclic phosphodiesterase
MLIIDAGSGIVGFGESLGSRGRRVPILLSHYHWDHVQGLPFFGPLYLSGFTATVHAPRLDGHDAASITRKVFEAPFFPLLLDSLPAPPDIQVDLVPRRSASGRSISPRCDSIIRGVRWLFGSPAETAPLSTQATMSSAAQDIDRELIEFLSGASAAILDAHFTPDEEPAHRGWGHSSWAGAVSLGLDAGVKRLFLFHHKPGRTDNELDEIERQARLRFPDTFVRKATFV